MKIKIIFILLVNLIFISCNKKSGDNWELIEDSFAAKDGFVLSCNILRPKKVKEKLPAVLCVHQLWGNRDDFLKLYNDLVKRGIVALAPDYPRQRPTLDFRRVSDINDSIAYLKTLPYVDSNRIAVITASFSVETGSMAIKGDKGVKALVMISGQVLSEFTRRWFTLNPSLAILNIASYYEGNHHFIMEECLARSLNPLSKNIFFTDKENKYSIWGHGTFSFDEFPHITAKIGDFLMKSLRSKKTSAKGFNEKFKDSRVEIISKDGFPVYATFKFKQDVKDKERQAVILYPPQFYNRRYYNSLIEKLYLKNFVVLAPNTKRTCRFNHKLHFCEKEVGGAVDYLKKYSFIKHKTVVFPAFYFKYAKKAVEEGQLDVDKIVFIKNTGMTNYGIDPNSIKSDKYQIEIMDNMDLERLFLLIKKEK